MKRVEIDALRARAERAENDCLEWRNAAIDAKQRAERAEAERDALRAQLTEVRASRDRLHIRLDEEADNVLWHDMFDRLRERIQQLAQRTTPEFAQELMAILAPEGQ